MKFLKNAVDKKRNFKEVDEIELPVFELDENMGIPENFILASTSMLPLSKLLNKLPTGNISSKKVLSVDLR